MVLTLGLLMSERQCFKHDFPANRCASLLNGSVFRWRRRSGRSSILESPGAPPGRGIFFDQELTR
jgi:hypothetical protein